MTLLWIFLALTSVRFSESSEIDLKSRMSASELTVLLFHSGNRLSELMVDMLRGPNELLKIPQSVLVERFNCSSGGRAVCDEFAVEKIPVIKLYKNGDFYKNYEGRKEGKHFVKYVKRLIGPFVKRLDGEEDLTLLLKTRFNTVVCFCEPDSKLGEIVSQIAREKVDRFNFAVYDGTFDSYNVSQNTVILIRPKFLQSKFEPVYLTYPGKAIESKLSDWLINNQYGLFHVRTKENYQEFSTPLVAAYMFIHDSRISDFKFWRNRLLKVSIEFLDRFYFAINDLEDFYQDLDTFGQFLNPTESPVVCLMGSNHYRFPMVDSFSMDNYRKFLKEFLTRGKARAYLQSDQPKPDDDKKPVKRVVGSRFVDMVINNDRDSFLLICLLPMGECNDIEKAWTVLATDRLKDEPIDYLSMDMRNNSWSHHYLFEGHPTVYWAGRYKKTKPILYQEDLTLDGFFYFIAEHSTQELENFDRQGRPKTQKDEL